MLYPYAQNFPQVHPSVYIAPGAMIIGRVKLQENVSVWFNAVIRGDVDEVIIGANTNIQDCCVVHQETGYPCIIGRNVTVGHSAVLHGCTIEDGAFIGMGAVLLNGAKIGNQAVVGAKALVTENQIIPPRSLVLGIPAKVVRFLSDEELQRFGQNAEHYLELAQQYIER